jgi:hypothetical protein
MDLHCRRRSGGIARSARRRLVALIGKSSFSAFALVCLSAMLPGGAARGQPVFPAPTPKPLFPTPALMDRPPQVIVSEDGRFSNIPALPMVSGPISLVQRSQRVRGRRPTRNRADVAQP